MISINSSLLTLIIAFVIMLRIGIVIVHRTADFFRKHKSRDCYLFSSISSVRLALRPEKMISCNRLLWRQEIFVDVWTFFQFTHVIVMGSSSGAFALGLAWWYRMVSPLPTYMWWAEIACRLRSSPSIGKVHAVPSSQKLCFFFVR